MPIPTYCRLCEGACGLQAHVQDGRLRAFDRDPTDPVSHGFMCDLPAASIATLAHSERITRPMKREGGVLVPSSWEEAIRDVGARLRKIRGRTGPKSIGLFAGDETLRSSQGLVRALSFGVGMGTPNLFSAQCLGAGPRLAMTEHMLGHAAPLLSDLGRAHYAVLLGGGQRETHWGPLTPGMAHEEWIAFSRKTKGTKVVVADPRKTPLATAMDQHIAIRPGTEPFFLVGMLAATVRGGWEDRQFVRDYTRNRDALERLLEPWTVERCATACGIEPAQLSGVALKFGRAAMAVAHAGPGAFANSWSSVGAWAWLALHTVTANTLRPGALYDHAGIVDLHAGIAAVPSSGAPRTRVGGLPIHLVQAPATVLADEALVPGEGQLRALVVTGGDPLVSLPGSKRLREALGGLDLLVCLSRFEDETARLAQWVLPVAHPWERSDMHLVDANLLPFHGTSATPALVPIAGEARPEADVLRDLFAAVHPGIRSSSWGSHLGMAAQVLARADLGAWQDRLLDWLTGEERAALAEPPYRLHKGDANRANWRVTTTDGRIDLLPEVVAGMVAELAEPRPDPERPLWLRTSARRDRAPDRWHRPAGTVSGGAFVHPSLGIPDGAAVRVSTRSGELQTVARHDPSLRPDTVDVPYCLGVDAGALVGTDRLDPLSGAAPLDGLACAVTAT